MMKHTEQNLANRIAKQGQHNIHVNITQENLNSRDGEIKRHDGQQHHPVNDSELEPTL